MGLITPSYSTPDQNEVVTLLGQCSAGSGIDDIGAVEALLLVSRMHGVLFPDVEANQQKTVR